MKRVVRGGAIRSVHAHVCVFVFARSEPSTVGGRFVCIRSVFVHVFAVCSEQAMGGVLTFGMVLFLVAAAQAFVIFSDYWCGACPASALAVIMHTCARV